MKKLFVVAALLTTMLVSAQDKRWAIGPVAGTGISAVRHNKIDYSYPAAGINAGLVLQYRMKEHTNFQMNLLFDQAAFANTIELTDAMGNPTGHFRARWRSEYISLPIMINKEFGNKTRFVLNAGIYASYLLRNHNGVFGKPSLPFNQQIQKLDAGMLIGIGMRHAITEKTAFHVELRNTWGLMKLYNFHATGQRTSHLLLVYLTFVLGNSRELATTTE